MSFRFRKSISLLPGLRLNVGTSGASLSAGVPGASVNIGRNGATATLGLPEAGLSYTRALTSRAHSDSPASGRRSEASNAQSAAVDASLSGEERRAQLLPSAIAVVENPKVREAWETFVAMASQVSDAGAIFEILFRHDVRGDVIGGRQAHVIEQRQIFIGTRDEPLLGPGGRTVTVMGGMYCEFLPGRFFANGQDFDGLAVALDVGAIQVPEPKPSGDSDALPPLNGVPQARYVRVEISCGSLRVNLAISNMQLAGFFVAAYRNYIEVLAGRPYKQIHPYRDLNTAPQVAAGATPYADAGTELGRSLGLMINSVIKKTLIWGGGFLAFLVVLGTIVDKGSSQRQDRPAQQSYQAPPAAQSPGTPSAANISAATRPVTEGVLRETQTKQGANVRSSPIGDASIVRTLGKGTPVRVLEVSGGWNRVSLSEGASIGWIHRSLLE